MNIQMNREARYDIVYAQTPDKDLDRRVGNLELQEERRQRQRAYERGREAGACQNCLNTLLCISFWSILCRR